jgi:hypothetical protein
MPGTGALFSAICEHDGFLVGVFAAICGASTLFVWMVCSLYVRGLGDLVTMRMAGVG